ncbi:hypothetical protein PCANC_07303 [Puccinia coronata f. sp. avenae]|uniref:endo-1,4-beta-xylanase n=1 Tax=Puccinia coronata f. sp. avenae TaxID=200324 RepID=A0A2N5T6F5_9BASI|nr:hypothetical protein PCANC_07303 [Puccinia coronata f. sp. avenae]
MLFMLRLLFVILLRLWQLRLASTAPRPDGGPSDHGCGSGQQCPLMGVGITADGLKIEKYRDVVNNHFKVLTPGNEMKWDHLEPQQGHFDFAAANEIHDYAKQNGKFLRIHTMFAKNQNPDWIKSGSIQPQDMKNAMSNILEKVISQYSDLAIGMDVCNEILNDQGNLDDQNPWLPKLGDNWVYGAFDAAKSIRDKYNKDMLLFINDFSIESINPKSDGMLRLATGLKNAGLLDAVGFQTHLIVNQVPPDFKQNLERFTKAGLKVAITELDIRLPVTGQPPVASQQDKDAQKNDYAKVFDICKSVDGCVSVTVWGVTYKDSWIENDPQFYGYGEATLFDNDYNPTEAMQNLQSTYFSSTTH